MTKGDLNTHHGTVVAIAGNHILIKNKYATWELTAIGINSTMDNFFGKNVKVTIEEE